MGYTNNATVKEGDLHSEEKKHFAVNSIQNTAYVKRMCVRKPYSINNIYHYDHDNLYPQKVVAITERSWATSSCKKTFSDFVSGDGWSDENVNKEIFNSEGLTGYELLRNISNEKALFGFALHFNYNLAGLITEITPIDFEDLRVTFDKKLAYNDDWSNYAKNDTVVYNAFNPDNAIDEIREVGIENYTGQVLYWTGTNKIYPLAKCDAAIDSAQYQAESELFKLRNVQNDFSVSGVLKYPIAIDSNREWQAAKAKIQNEAVGANNAGRIILMGTTPDIDSSGNFFEKFERNNADTLFVNQNKEAKEIIFSIYRQPMILGAINPGGGWPNAQEMQDAFEFYNSIVEQDRKEIEKTMKTVFDNSIWNYNEVTILPKKLIKNGTEPGVDNAE